MMLMDTEENSDGEKIKANKLLFLSPKALPEQSMPTSHCLKCDKVLANRMNSSPQT